jgi:hypothetical protein
VIRAALVGALVALPGATEPLDDFFASVKQDGPATLPEAVRLELVKLLPAPGRGQQCEKAAEVKGDAVALKDRGDGALLIAVLSSCHGETAFAFGPGTPVRVAKLFENEDDRKLVTAVALPLRGGRGAREEIGLVLAGTTSELRFFVRRSESGFSFAPSGSLPDFSFKTQCDEGDQDHVSGHRSLLRVADARRLWRLRLEQRCGGGLSSVRCEVWHLDQGQLEQRGACALPVKLEEAELRKAGWQ